MDSKIIDLPDGVHLEFTVNDEGHLCCKARFEWFAQIHADDAAAVLSASNGAEYMMMMAHDTVKALIRDVRFTVNNAAVG